MNSTEILQLAEGFTKRTLLDTPPKQMCFTICYPLSLYLHSFGIANTIVGGDYKKMNGERIPHYWLLLGDGSGNIVDPTIRQFDKTKPDVHFGAKPDNFEPGVHYSFDNAFKEWNTPLLHKGYRFPKLIEYDPTEAKKHKIPLKKYIPVNLRAAELLLAKMIENQNKIVVDDFEKYFDCISEVVINYNGRYGINKITFPNLFQSYSFF